MGRTLARLAAPGPLLLALLLGVMLATATDYGMTVDEGVQHRYGNRLVRWYATLGADRAAVEQHDTFYYGGLFELLAQGAVRLLPLGVYDARHVANALFGFLGLVAAGWAGRQLGGRAGGLLATVFLALTPAFYGHSFNNPKDAPFASLFALALAATLWAGEPPRPPWPRVLAAGVAIGLAAGVRVAGLVLLPAAAALWLGGAWLGADGSARRGAALLRLAASVGVALAVAWAVMVALWPFAQLDPLRNPFRALQAFSRFWETMPVLFEGRVVLSGELPRRYVPAWFALTLPEAYLVALAMGAGRLAAALRARREAPGRAFGRWRLLWLAAVTAGPVAWVVVRHTPLYDGHRHLLFVLPGLAVLAGVSAAAWLRAASARARAAGGAVLAAALLATLADMAALHPYQSLYFNRLVAGGLPGAASRYETDYWCQTYREGLEWAVGHYGALDLREPVRVAGHATLTQVRHDLERDAHRRRRFRAVTVHDDPHVVLATTSSGDHERTPGRVVHVVRRQGVPLLHVVEARPPG
jgi:hypothetical protein